MIHTYKCDVKTMFERKIASFLVQDFFKKVCHLSLIMQAT